MSTRLVLSRIFQTMMCIVLLGLLPGCPGQPDQSTSAPPVKKNSQPSRSRPSPSSSVAEIQAEQERLAKISDEIVGLWSFRQYYQPKGFENAPSTGVFYLDLHDATRFEYRNVAEGSLFRELPRQALLLSAREEFGLLTRDRALREEFPWARGLGKHWPLSVVTLVSPTFQATISVIRHQRNGVEVLWTQEYDLDAEAPYEHLTRLMEEISRKQFVEVLLKEGYPRPESKRGEPAPLPDDIEQNLDTWNDVAQVAAIRQLHDLMRTSGETPETLAGLARGYAQLAELTATYYSSMHKAFQARALLYAERLMSVTEGNALALWHRAYVRTLVGLPEAALTDIEQALSSDRDALDAPWCAIIHAYCQGDFRELDRRRKEFDAHPLAAFLYLDCVRYLTSSEDFVDAAETAARTAPEAMRPYHELWSYQSLGTKGTSQSAIRKVSEIETRHLTRVPGLVESTRELVDSQEEITPQRFHEVVLSLKEAGRPEVDPREFSLDALGQIIREAAFTTTWEYLHYLKSWLGVPIEEEVATWRPLVMGHPYEPAVDATIAIGAERMKLGRAWIFRINRSDFEFSSLEVLLPLFNTSRNEASRLNRYAWRHCDATSQELQVRLKIKSLKENRPTLFAQLKKVSPREIKTISEALSNETDQVKDRLPDWEKQYEDVSFLQRDLSHAYRKLGDVDGAERCLLRMIKSHPSFESYQELAELSRIRGEEEGWLRASLESLEFPVPGLESVRVQEKIARYYHDRGQDRLALRHADQAAMSYAGGALELAQRIHSREGNWKQAEEYIAACARRYESWASAWLKWCRKTGRGDVASALALGHQWAESGAARADSHQKAILAEFYELSDEKEKAFQVLAELARQEHYQILKWHAFVLADDLGKEPEREEFRKMLLESDPTDYRDELNGSGPLIHDFLTTMSAAGQKLDPLRINDMLSRLPRRSSIILSYFLGRLLLKRGLEDEGKQLLRNSAASAEEDYGIPLRAIWLLRQLGEEVPAANKYGSRHWSRLPESSHSLMLQASAPIRGVLPLEGSLQIAVWDEKGSLNLRSRHVNDQPVPLRDADGEVITVTNDGRQWAFIPPFSRKLEIWRRDEATVWRTQAPLGARLFVAHFDPQNPTRLLRGDCRYLLEDHPHALLSFHDLEKQTELWRRELGEHIPTGLVSLGKNEFLVYGRNRRSQGWCGIYSRETGEQIRSAEIDRHQIAGFHVSKNGEHGVSFSPHGEVVLWEMKNLSPAQRLWRQSPTAVSLSPDGKLLVIGEKSGNLTFIEWKADHVVGEFGDHQQAVTQLQFSEDGQELISGSDDYSCRIWNVKQLQQEAVGGQLQSGLLVNTNQIGMALLPVPAGEFLMGERDKYEPHGNFHDSLLKQERPRHRVFLSRPYYLSQTEVTVQQFQQFVKATGYRTFAEEQEAGGQHLPPPEAKLAKVPGSSWKDPGFPQTEDHPVVMVTYEDALAFCRWLSQVENAVYRLPTEAEWEKACRAGTESSWSYGNRMYPLNQSPSNCADLSIRRLYTHYQNSSEFDDGFAFTAPVASYPPNAYGFYDMHGNVFEWCQDYFAPDYYATSPEIDPQGPDAGDKRSLRSGSFFNFAPDSRSAFRDYDPPETAFSCTGFRVLKEVPRDAEQNSAARIVRPQGKAGENAASGMKNHDDKR